MKFIPEESVKAYSDMQVFEVKRRPLTHLNIIQKRTLVENLID